MQRTRKRRRKKRTKKRQLQKEPRKFGGITCVEIPIEDLAEGDYVFYWDSGQRVGKVKKNHKGYKHRWVRLYPSMWKGHTLRRGKKIKPELIRSAWRNQELVNKEKEKE